MHQILAELNFISKYCYACSNIVNENASFMKKKHVAATVEVLQKPPSVIDRIWKPVAITLLIEIDAVCWLLFNGLYTEKFRNLSLLVSLIMAYFVRVSNTYVLEPCYMHT